MSLRELTVSFSDADRQRLPERLGPMIRRQMELFADFESSSVSVENARSVLESLLFVLEHAAEEDPSLLLRADPRLCSTAAVCSGSSARPCPDMKTLI